MATKLASVLGLVLPAAVLAYPFCFLLGDVMTEVYGLPTAKKVVWLAFFANALVVLWTALGIYMPYPSFWGGQTHYAYILGFVPRIVLGSFLAYLVGENINVWVMEKLKSVTGKQLWVRTIGSSAVGQIFDTLIFISIAFFGTMPTSVFITMIITQYLFKLACEAFIGTPLAYPLVRWARSDAD
jgi:uncharacterized integral membrane protein (TIGR00697 family)